VQAQGLQPEAREVRFDAACEHQLLMFSHVMTGVIVPVAVTDDAAFAAAWLFVRISLAGSFSTPLGGCAAASDAAVDAAVSDELDPQPARAAAPVTRANAAAAAAALRFIDLG
jgi:hypothetical protein